MFYSNTVGDMSENFLNLNAREVIMEAFCASYRYILRGMSALLNVRPTFLLLVNAWNYLETPLNTGKLSLLLRKRRIKFTQSQFI